MMNNKKMTMNKSMMNKIVIAMRLPREVSCKC